MLTGLGSRVLNFGLATGDDTAGKGEWATGGGYYQQASIRRARALGIVARASGGKCLAIRNYNSSGVIEDIEVADFTVLAGPNTTAPLVVENVAGGVRRIRFNAVSVFTDPATAVAQTVAAIDGVDDFTWDGARLDGAVSGDRRRARARDRRAGPVPARRASRSYSTKSRWPSISPFEST